jgi:hypothetical protein
MDCTAISTEQAPGELTGYELVADMMRRQDEAIAQIDELNERVEAAIREITAARRAEEEAGSDEIEDAAGEPSIDAALTDAA